VGGSGWISCKGIGESGTASCEVVAGSSGALCEVVGGAEKREGEEYETSHTVAHAHHPLQTGVHLGVQTVRMLTSDPVLILREALVWF
jgi:hypothetical protein